MALDFLAGCAGGCAGILVGHPLDTIKVNVQTQDHRNPVYRGSLHCFSSILQREGVTGLYRGMAAPLCGVAAVNALTFGVYGAVHRRLGGDTVGAQLASGALSGLVQSLVGAPLELVKTRGQVLGLKPLSCIAAIVRCDGPRGLFRGLCATAARDTPALAIYFATYEALTQGDVPASTPRVLLSGGAAGAASWLFTYPLDVLKSRLQMDGVGAGPRKYTGLLDCLRQSVRDEGVWCLTRGLSTVMVRAFPTNAACFFAVALVLRWDQSKATPSSLSDCIESLETPHRRDIKTVRFAWRRGQESLEEALRWRRNLATISQCNYFQRDRVLVHHSALQGLAPSSNTGDINPGVNVDSGRNHVEEESLRGFEVAISDGEEVSESHFNFSLYSIDVLDSPWLEVTDTECVYLSESRSARAHEVSWNLRDDGDGVFCSGFLYTVDILDYPWLQSEDRCIGSVSSSREGTSESKVKSSPLGDGHSTCDSVMVGSPGSGVVRKPDALRLISHAFSDGNLGAVSKCDDGVDLSEEYSTGFLLRSGFTGASMEAALLAESSSEGITEMTKLLID